MPHPLRRRLLLFDQRSVRARAVAWWQARFHDANAGYLADLSGMGIAHPAQLGSTAGADSNDPTYDAFSGTVYGWLPGTAGNSFSVPDAAALDIVGDIEIRCRVAPASWTPVISCALVSKWVLSGSQRSYMVQLNTNGTFDFIVSADGATTAADFAFPATGLAANVERYLRFTMDLDNGAGASIGKAYTSTDGVTWVQLGTDQSAAVVASIYVSTAGVSIGSRSDNNALPVLGKIFSAQIYNGIGGTAALDVDLTDLSKYNAGRTALTAVSGQAVTVNHSATGLQTTIVERNVFSTGADDYFNVTDHADLNFLAPESFAYGWVGRKYSTTSNTALIAKKADFTTDVGYSLDGGTGGLTPRAVISDGTNTVTATGPAMTAGVFSAVVVVRGGGYVTVYVSGVAGTPVADTITGTLVNTNDLRIARLSGAGTSYGDQETLGGFVKRGLLSASDVARLSGEFGV